MSSDAWAVPAEQIAAVRSFNRFYTGVIGVLDEGLVDTPYSLTEARVIFELAQRDARETTELRRDIGLDAGYLSRMLSRFETDGLVVRERAADDARRQVVRLTAQGREVFAMLDGKSAEQVARLLGPLPEDARRRLIGAMEAIRRVLGESAPASSYTLRPLSSGDYGWVIARHGLLYASEYGWNVEFEALVARIVADYAASRGPGENAWIAEVDGEPVGCVFCVRDREHEQGERVAKLRLLLVEPSARGMGIGARLVEECVAFARRQGYAELVLWTNDVLTAARRIYERAGFKLVDEGPHHSFGKDLVEQTWRLPL